MVSALVRFRRLVRRRRLPGAASLCLVVVVTVSGLSVGPSTIAATVRTQTVEGAIAATSPTERLLPTSLPDGLSASDVGNVVDRIGPSSAVSYVHVLRDAKATQQFFIVATPYDKASYEAAVTERLSSGAKSVTVRGRAATLFESGASISIAWFEGKTSLLIDSEGVSRSSALVFAAGVTPTKKGDASFVLKRRASGFATVFVGPTSRLSSSASSVSWQNSDQSKVLTLNVAAVIAAYIDVVHLGPGSTFQPTSVRGKSAYISSVGDQRTLIWMEQPLVFVELTSEGIDESSLRAAAEALQTVDEATWKSRTRS